MSDPEYLTITQIHERLRRAGFPVRRPTIQSWARAGKLPGATFVGTYRVKTELYVEFERKLLAGELDIRESRRVA